MDSIPESRKLLGKPEKIVLLFDLHVENAITWDSPSSSSSSSSSAKRFEVVAQGLETFVRRKANFPCPHKFALVAYHSSQLCGMNLVQDFTSDLSEMFNALANLQQFFSAVSINAEDHGTSQNVQGDECVDLSELLDNLTKLLATQNGLMENEYLTRCVLVYGRSNSVPTISKEISLIKNSQFYVDILYVHLKPSFDDDTMRCQEIYDTLAQIQAFMNEAGKTSHVYETFHSMMRLTTYCSMLVAHPAQRCDQEEMMVKVDISDRCIQEMKNYL